MGVDCVAYKLKIAQIFAISIRNLEYLAEKEARPEINLKSVVSEEYKDF